MEYLSRADDDSDTGCIFCESYAGREDELTHVLYRGAEVFVLLNAFPYNTGHLMIAPVRHTGELHDLTREERIALMDLVASSTEIIREAMGPEGFNVGINLGRVAGAGIPGHVHVHVVPRWGGDTNYMPAVAKTRVLPEMLADTAAKLRPGFESL